MDHLMTTSRVIFDFIQAAEQGYATDQNGTQHTFIFAGKKFVVSQIGEEQYCFNMFGEEFANPRKLQLVKPSMTEIRLLPYLVYDRDKMTIVQQNCTYPEARKAVQKSSNPALDVINTTQPGNESLLASLGINKTTWTVK